MGDVVSIGPLGPLGVDATGEELLGAAICVVGLAIGVVTALVVLMLVVEEALVDGDEAMLLSAVEVVVTLSAVLDVVVDVVVEVATMLEVELEEGTGAALLPATYSYMESRLLPPQISEGRPEQVMLHDAPPSSVGAPPLLRVFPQ